MSDIYNDSHNLNQAGYRAKHKHNPVTEAISLIGVSLLVYYIVLTFIARPYLIPSESMEPTLHGCAGCVEDRIVVDKLTYRFHAPRPGDVVVFRGPDNWNTHYRSIRSSNQILHHIQDALAKVGLAAPDENDLVKRVIAVGGQTVQCRLSTGLTVDGHRVVEPYLRASVLMVDPETYRCLGREFGPITIPAGRLWVMGDNRTHSADSRAHCTNTLDGMREQIFCTGDPENGTVPISNVIGQVRFIVWPPTRIGIVKAINPQHFHLG